MLPRRFKLHRPDTIPAALELLARYGSDATAYAGGTEIMLAMKARVLSYTHVVDLKRIGALRGVSTHMDGSVVIGALVTHHELANHPLIREKLPGYAELSDNIANIRVRTVGTLGGNLCFAEPHADPPAMLCALEANLTLASANGERQVDMENFIRDSFTTVCASAELLVHVNVPPLPRGARAAYRAFGHLERPAAGVAVVALPSGTGFHWRFWAGAVGSRPARIALLEKATQGLNAKDAVAAIKREAAAAAHGLEADTDLHGSADFKRHLVTVLARRAAEACVA